MVKMQCSECGKTFCSQSSLTRHNKELHQKPELIYICSHCGKEFVRKRNLTIHIQNVHTDYTDRKNFSVSRQKYTCSECGRQLSRKNILLHHIKVQHPACDESLPSNPKSQTCVKCLKDFVNETLILKHIENDHGIPLKRETISFELWENFVRWKDEVETKTFCRYVKRTTTKLKFEEVTYYYCERRGFHIPPSHRKRREWSHGTKKINGYCPAKIIVRRHMITGDIKTNYCSSHMHSVEPKNLKYSRFSRKIKNAVAQKLAAQIPIDQILKDIRTSKSKEYLEKGQMMTRKDILNIARAENLQNLNRKSVKDTVEIETFTEKHSESILLYKKQGEISNDCPKLRSDDFVLIYMNKKQKEYFQRFGNNILAMDEMHGLDEYGFILHTLMVLDDFDQGFPACFLFTNRNDETAIEILFQCIKNKIGTLNVNTFLSDMQEKYFNAYLKVMKNKPNFYLYCSWHVRKAWKQNLAKIKGVEKKRETEKKLYFLHGCNDVSVFEQKMTEFCSNLDSDLVDFMEYFRSNFVNNEKQWAYCYRQYSGLNTSMVIKNFHRQIKHNFGNGSKITHLPDGLALIESYLENREQNDLIYAIKGHVSTKVSKLRKAHDAAKKQLDAGVGIRKSNDNDTSWTVESFNTSDKEYVVTSYGDCIPDCKLMCEKCFCCSHMFKCTCIENSIRNIMCKHIHAVCLQQIVEQEVVKAVDSESEMIIEDDISISSPIAVYQFADEEDLPESIDKYEEESKAEWTFEYREESRAKLLEISEQNRKLFESIMSAVGSSSAKNNFVKKALEDLEAAVLAMQDHEWDVDEYKAGKKSSLHETQF